MADFKHMFNEPHKYVITITRKSDDSVVRVLKAVHYTVDNCDDLDNGIPNISIIYEDADGKYRTAYYPLLSYNFEILDI